MGIWHKKRNKKIIKEFNERYKDEFLTGEKLCKEIRHELAEKYKVTIELVDSLVYPIKKKKSK